MTLVHLSMSLLQKVESFSVNIKASFSAKYSLFNYKINVACVCSVLGHVDVVIFLTQACKVNPFVKDRYRSLFLYTFITSAPSIWS